MCRDAAPVWMQRSLLTTLDSGEFLHHRKCETPVACGRFLCERMAWGAEGACVRARVRARDRRGQSRGSPVCGCCSHDTAPTGSSQVGGASGFPAAQSGPPAPWHAWRWWEKLSPTRPTSLPTPPSQSVTARCSQALKRTHVHAHSGSCPYATGAWDFTACPLPRAPLRFCPQLPLPM